MASKKQILQPRHFRDEDKSSSTPSPRRSQPPNSQGSQLAQGEKTLIQSLETQLDEAMRLGGQEVSKLIEKALKTVSTNEESISNLQKTLTKSRGSWKEELKVKGLQSANCLLSPILPLFQQALAKGSLSGLQELLKITLLYQYEGFNGMEKQLTPILDLFTKMLQIAPQQKEEEEHAIGTQVQRLVLMNIINMFSPGVGVKFQIELQLIVKRVYELLLHFCGQLGSHLQNTSVLQLIATLLRSASSVLLELKENKQFNLDANIIRITEKVLTRIFKLLFLGNPVFHNQLFGIKNQVNNNVSFSVSSDSTAQSSNSGSTNLMNSSFSAGSQSEQSENEELLGQSGKNKLELVQAKIRTQVCLFIQTVIKQFPSVLRSQWQLLIKSADFSKEFINLIFSKASLQPQSTALTQIILNNFSEPSLLSGAVLEEFPKVRANIIATLGLLVEVYPSRQLLSGLDVQKISSSFKTQAFLIFSAYKNLHFSLIYLMKSETSTSLIQSVLKVYLNLLSLTPQFEIMNFNEGLELLLQFVIMKGLNTIESSEEQPSEIPEILNNSISYLESLHIRYNSLQAISSILKLQKQFTGLIPYLKEENGIISQCLREASSKRVKSRGILESNEDTLREMISLESVHLLGHLQKNYLLCTLERNETKDKWTVWTKIKNVIQQLEEERLSQNSQILSIYCKRIAVLYELVEKIAEQTSVEVGANTIEDDDQQENNNEDNDESQIQQNQEEKKEEENQKEEGEVPSLEQPIEINNYGDFYHNELQEYLIQKVKQLTQPALKSQKKILSDSESILISSGLSLSKYVSDACWNKQVDITNQIKETLLTIELSTQLRFHYFKAVGALTFRKQFSIQDERFYSQILDELIRQKQEISNSKSAVKKQSANLQVFSKLSQTFANWCYNCNDLSILSPSNFSELFLILIELAASPKDKISPHGLRAIGIILMKISQKEINKQDSVQKSIQQLPFLIKEQLTHKSVKIVWNACVAVASIFKNKNKLVFFDAPNLEIFITSIEGVLVNSENEKSQLYALRALQSIVDSNQFNLITSKISQNLLHSLSQAAGDSYAFQTSRSSPHNNSQPLGELIVKLLMQSIQKIDYEKDRNTVLAEFIKEKSFVILGLLGQYLHQLWKNNRLDFHLSLKLEEAFNDNQSEIFNYKAKQIQNETIVQKQDQIQELKVKGQDEFKSIQFDFKCIQTQHDALRKELSQFKSVAIILQRIIDDNDDLCVSLAVYDCIKEYANTDVSQEVVKYSFL